MIPETENTFHSDFGGIAFIRDANGAATQVILHYPLPEDRMTIQPRIK